MKENSIEEDMKILEGIIKGDEDCINVIYSQMKVKNDNDEDIQYYKKEIQSIKNIVNNYLKEKARADKLEKEYSAMLTESDEDECDYKRVLKENEELKNNTRKNENELEFDIDCDWIALQKILDESERSNEYISYKNEKWIKEKYCVPIQKIKDKIEEIKERKMDIVTSPIHNRDEKIEILKKDKIRIQVLQELLEK